MNWYKKSQFDQGDIPSGNIEPQPPIEDPPLEEKRSPYRGYYPKVRGEWTMDKIKRQLRQVSSTSGLNSFNAEVMSFSSPQELEDNLYYHGTGGGVSGGLQTGFRKVRNGVGGGGGYGENYYSISLSKDKNTASNFTADSAYGTVYPVILKKNATIIEMPQVEDALELEESLPNLWGRGIDAIKIGDWSNDYSEQELVVLNPKAIHIGQGESFAVFQKKRFSNPSMEEITNLWQESGDKYEQWATERGKGIPSRRRRTLENFKNNKESFLNARDI